MDLSPEMLAALWSEPAALPKAVVAAMGHNVPMAMQLARLDPTRQAECVAEATKSAAATLNLEALRAFAPLCPDLTAPTMLLKNPLGDQFSLIETLAFERHEQAIECLRFLEPLAQWSSPDRPCGALHIAVGSFSLGIVDFLLPLRGVGARDAQGRTPLLCAAQCGHEELIQKLVSGADLSERFECLSGGTVLMAAASHGNRLAVARLLELGCDARATDNKGRSALMLAAARGKRHAAEALLPLSDLSQTDENGKTAFELWLEGDDLDFLGSSLAGQLLTERDLRLRPRVEQRYSGDLAEAFARVEAEALQRATGDFSEGFAGGPKGVAPKRAPRAL